MLSLCVVICCEHFQSNLENPASMSRNTFCLNILSLMVKLTPDIRVVCWPMENSSQKNQNSFGEVDGIVII